ncbi:DEAD/DEAH box helicase, partial [Candidatus Poribacteria bacterium]|nr:DEAD/DEAH box helicase [Candidatus Poribacteria bacterium]
SRQTNPGFQSTLDYIREKSTSEYGKGELFERLMLTYFSEDPDYKEQFSEVYLYKQWAATRTEFDGRDIGVDLVAQKQDGGYCAIQCKCYAEDTRVSKPDIDSFISASASEIFTSRILVNTGGEIGENALRTITPLGDKFRVIRFSDLENSPFEWPDLSLQEPEQLTYKQRPFSLKDHQKEAFDDVIKGFKEYDRGKLIMACGTGKTFTALKIAEEIAGTDGRVLYLVPSIGLLSQAMREWSDQRGIPHSYIGICSDTSAGRTSEDASIQELKIDVTTDPSLILPTLQNPDSSKMTVVFCTYQSLPLIEEVQNHGAPPFDIIFCDEAHRTTGVDKSEDKTSPFVLVHDAARIRADKRLYMTATPKLYTENARRQAANYNVEVFSMDDEEKYGPQFHRLPFSRAVELGELSDYKVAIFGISEHEVNAKLAGNTGKYGSEININDATRIIGCWRALQNPENKGKDDETLRPLKRVIAFTNRINESKALARYWNDIIEDALEKLPEDEQPTNFLCETEHVDGTVHALNRKTRLDWLKNENYNDGEDDDVCRILSNARCLSEGIDVPALDAVIFYKPRKSHIDVVQAVGRVMRKAPGKQFGYVILPVAIPDDQDPAAALNDNERFSNVWSVLNALRSHDDRFDGQINSIDLNRELPDSIVIGGGSDWAPEQLSLLPVEIPVEAILSKIVQKCGDKPYWENWAKDVADIFERLVIRIQNLLDNPENATLSERFENFHSELKKTINTSITRDNAIDMMAQHILTSPVFDALFEDYDFSSGNPVATALDNLQKDFAEFGLENETRDLRGFYDSVQTRASGVKSSQGRQEVLSDLYEQFFKKALKKEADRLGIAYTPIPLVDFVLHSVNDILQEEFGKTISDKGVHMLDPFTGTGTFIVQLLQSGLIQHEDLERKYRKELHANEILLLAYYIASVNIEEAFRGQHKEDNGYEPFHGIILTDTFNLNKSEKPTLFPKERMVENNERAEHQQKLPIRVIVGNPPWKAKRKNAAEDSPNVKYPELRQRVRETYAARVKTRNKNTLYDSYKMAIRWASDRIGEHGIIGFVTSATWIDGIVDAGIRACLPEEFSSVYFLNLRGKAKASLREGEGVFRNATQSPVAIVILVKNPGATHEGCLIHYREIGDALKREEKFTALREAGSFSGFSDWEIITPNKEHDWIEHRSETFAQFYPLGSDDARDGKADDAIFKLFSSGCKTGRDPYLCNFSRDTCAKHAKRMTEEYLDAISELEKNPEIEQVLNEVMDRHNTNIKWDEDLEKKLKRRQKTKFADRYIRQILYRPFILTNCYADYIFIQRKYQMDKIFPDASSENRVICVPGKGAKNEGRKKQFSVLITDTMPDINLNEAGAQCFPRYQYLEQTDSSDTTNMFQGIDSPPNRIDNISDTALRTFREYYDNDTITKDTIFDYVYGILHAPSYREQFANDFSKMLPHIPYAPNFRAFAEAGKALADLHLNYETCSRYTNLKVEPRKQALFWEEKPEDFLLGTRAMRFADKNTKDTLIINEHIQLSGIPTEAHGYVVNGRTPLEWFINRYKITPPEKNNGILNDANGWFENPRDLVTAIERIVYVSVESTKIIEGLPSEITERD